MIYIKRFYNESLTSNTYSIFYSCAPGVVWLIDLVSSEVIDYYSNNGMKISGVFITHAHYDHIIGIRKLIDAFPDTKIFVSKYAALGLNSSKINLSYYYNDPIEIDGFSNVIEVSESSMEIFPGIYIKILETPGHNTGCLSFQVNNFLFTGDSYIPDTKVVTKLKGGDKLLSEASLKKIKNLFSDNTVICPGHGEVTKINGTSA